jgi:hypothetical protein
MNNSEQAIGKVFAGLRDAEAPQGMERRILLAMEARASERLAATPRWVWGVAFAGVVAVLLLVAITVTYRHGQTPTQARQHALPAESASSNQQALLLPPEPVAPNKRSHARKAPAISAEEARLLSDLRAPSHPAPAEPLTNEEKLLLRAVQTGDPQVMAMLNPEERARQEAASEAEFQKFMGQSGTDDQESNPTNE